MSTELLSGGDEFTAEERTYMESRGTKGFESTPEPAPAPEPAPSAPQGERVASNDDDYDGSSIEIGADGSVRDSKTGRYVPAAYASRIKEERDSLKTKYETIASDYLRMKERVSIWDQLAPKPEEPKPQAAPSLADVDPETDIFGAFKALQERTKALQDQLVKSKEETTAQFEARATNEYFNSDWAKGRQGAPDLDDALKYVMDKIDEDLADDGVTDPAERQKQILRATQEKITELRKSGKSFSEYVYKRAQRYGYQGKAAAPEAKPQIDPKAAAEIERINKGKAAASSLSGSGSASGAQELTREALINMSDRDFADAQRKYIEKHGRRGWADLMDGKR
jgi:hypothetical protein